jgi:hypothetical protein
MFKEYQAWSDPTDNSTTLTLAENIKEQLAEGILSPNAGLIYKIEAHTFEEASAIHHLRMGWGPYIPIGEPRQCPNQCGSMFYPDGSGECPNCGKIC